MVKIKQNGKRVWVTFVYEPEGEVASVMLSGEWNGWKEEPMKRRKDGSYGLTKVLRAGETHQFGYKVDGDTWVTDAACETVDSPFFSKNSLLRL